MPKGVYARKKRGGTTPTAPKVQYLERLIIDPSDVRELRFADDNAEYINPLCIDQVEDGQEVAVYEFAGLRRVKKHGIELV